MAIIAIDFDGTCVTHEYPRIGAEIKSIRVLKALKENGHKLVLNTMRSGKELKEAVSWLKGKGIVLDGVNEYPSQREWTSSSKTYADLYIDDAALGCPLLYLPDFSRRPFVDWKSVSMILMKYGMLTEFQYNSFNF